MRDHSLPINLLRSYSQRSAIPGDSTVLVLGAANDDVAILHGAGFHNLALSNVNDSGMQLNAEDIALEDESYDLVFAHAMLHHCRSPYKALAEMLRVSRRWIVFFEPNDSLAARLAVQSGLKQPYEIGAITDNQNAHGGVMDTDVPNFIHRWTPNELRKTAMSALPERKLACYSYRYWDFNLTQHEIEVSSSTWGNLAKAAQRFRGLMNALPPVRIQGNHFFGAVAKLGYQPWIKDGRFDPEYAKSKQPENLAVKAA
jgi:SAM-dependent methyltransferase